MEIVGLETEERVIEGGDKLIHPHPLQFLVKIPQNEYAFCGECESFCDKTIKVYGCLRCRYYIHPRCHPVQKVKEVQPLCHPCLLIAKRGTRVIFHCNKCDFNLDPECIDVSPATPSNIKTVLDKELQSSTKYFSHEHLLILYINMPRDRVYCRVCRKYCADNAYGCLPCAFFLDPSCAELKLPREIQHFYHSCLLTLACHQTFPYEAFYYGCLRCLFVMDIDCTLLSASLATGSSSQRKHHPIFHGHPLSLYEEKNEGQVNCSVCGKGCNSSSAIYSCGRSTCRDIYIDESCIKLPLQIYHPLHLSHPLFLLEQKVLKCNACDKSCESSIFSCLHCHWNLHYTCGPLPNRITDKCHEDPLVLTTALAEHEDEMDDEFYCDVCEKQRDQLLPSYQCTDCNFVSEIGCVKSEFYNMLWLSLFYDFITRYQHESSDNFEASSPQLQVARLQEC
ncbi:hypothetical protein I3760_05G217100 [Carya illinoinensis]|nr:hypothetical protein I3760_05G217100 [Carya illinoinensis]